MISKLTENKIQKYLKNIFSENKAKAINIGNKLSI